MSVYHGSGPLYLALIAALTAGYWLGSSRQARKLAPPVTRRNPHASAQRSSGSEESEAEEDGTQLAVDPNDDIKLVLVVRKDLGMSSGKIAAQCSHATLACYKALQKANLPVLRQWERTGQTKIALGCKDEEELLLLQAQAHSLGLCARTIQDAGRTQIAAGSRTVVGILGPVRLVNRVTGALRLL